MSSSIDSSVDLVLNESPEDEEFLENRVKI